MKYDFLANFPRRMRNVGLYSILIQNIVQKNTWIKYNVKKSDEQINITFTVMLFLMENSLKETPCTIDDIAAYLDSLSEYWPDKNWKTKRGGDYLTARFVICFSHPIRRPRNHSALCYTG